VNLAYNVPGRSPGTRGKGIARRTLVAYGGTSEVTLSGGCEVRSEPGMGRQSVPGAMMAIRARFGEGKDGSGGFQYGIENDDEDDLEVE
jgi:hypothetical protein